MPRQLALPLSGSIPRHERLKEVPEDLLRAAWQRSRLKIGFEEAMQLAHFRIGLSHVAMAMASYKGVKK